MIVIRHVGRTEPVYKIKSMRMFAMFGATQHSGHCDKLACNFFFKFWCVSHHCTRSAGNSNSAASVGCIHL